MKQISGFSFQDFLKDDWAKFTTFNDHRNKVAHEAKVATVAEALDALRIARRMLEKFAEL